MPVRASYEYEDTMKNEELKITGMSCNHCVMSLRKELSKVPGLEVKDVRIGAALVTYDESKVTGAQLRSAVEEAGFTLT
ncbi:MAG TPA: heavy-metal-associated domain-containing protein [Bacteroidota bacterium]|nr:heavy-metal-associated domain-containing protein [Bacteroidota bacterium]